MTQAFLPGLVQLTTLLKGFKKTIDSSNNMTWEIAIGAITLLFVKFILNFFQILFNLN
jgi:hypothetical protein